MRLITWNCRVGGFRKKARHIAPLRPDVLAVQEVENIDSQPILEGEDQPTFRNRVADPAYPKRAIGVFSYTDVALDPVDLSDTMYAFRRFEARRAGLLFQVAAVWNAATESRDTSYRQAHHGLRCHDAWIRRRPTVVLGDFNGNASYRGGDWQELSDLMAVLGLVSAYHHHFGEAFGRESRPTYFHHGKGSGFHVDYCFLPEAWATCIANVEVGLHRDWHEISDHVPLTVDLALPDPPA